MSNEIIPQNHTAPIEGELVSLPLRPIPPTRSGYSSVPHAVADTVRVKNQASVDHHALDNQLQLGKLSIASKTKMHVAHVQASRDIAIKHEEEETKRERIRCEEKLEAQRTQNEHAENTQRMRNDCQKQLTSELADMFKSTKNPEVQKKILSIMENTLASNEGGKS